MNDESVPVPLGAAGRVRTFLEMIKVSHTLFALPFAIGASFLAAGGVPRGPLLIKIVLAVLFARTAAMAFNRWIDRRHDAANPRTRDRALPTGRLTPSFVITTVGLSGLAFVAVAGWIGPLPLALSPVALAVLLGYSLTKRFTSLCHLALGAALGLAPVGAWVAVRGTLELAPWLLGAAVMLWTAGFDILYSTLDRDFDRDHGLHSAPVRFGLRGALRIAAALHTGMLLALGGLALTLDLGWVFFVAVGAAAVALVIEHRLVTPENLSRVNRAFFHWNVAISVALMLALIAEGLRNPGMEVAG